jgi:hypothetical protein
MGKQDRPTVTNPLVKIDLAVRGVGAKIRGFIIGS